MGSKDEHLRLIRYHADFGRSGALSGIFVLSIEEWELWNKLVNSKDDVYFGEVLGKHSEIEAPVEADDYSVVSEDQEFCRKFLALKLNTGINPLNYYDEE